MAVVAPSLALVRRAVRRHTTGGLALRLRNTFIDTDEAPEEDTCFRRTRSLPEIRSKPQKPAPFSEEEAYVAGLPSKLQEWAISVGTQVVSSSADSLSEASGDSPRAMFAGVAGDELGGRRSSADVLDFAMNDGSFGHPEVCARPCLFYASGKCDSGSACKFCHLSHVRLGSLKRDLRDHLRQLPTLAAKALILPVIEQKALLFDPSGEVEHAVVHLLQACFAGQEAPSWKKSRRDRALLATFHDMTLRLLLVSLRRSVLDAGDHEAHLAAEALAEQLRAPASPQGRHPKRGLFSL